MATLTPKQFAPPCPSAVPFEHPESFVEVSQNFKQVLKYISDLLCRPKLSCEDLCDCPPCPEPETPPDETGIVPEVEIALDFVPLENAYADRHSWISHWGGGSQVDYHVFETTTGLLKATVPKGGIWGGAAPFPARHEMWMNGRGSGGVAKLLVWDTLTLTEKAVYTYPGRTGKLIAAPVARCPDDDHIYAAFNQGVAQIDPETGALIKIAGFGDVYYMAWHAGHHAMICGDLRDRIWSFKPGLTDITGKSGALGGLIKTDDPISELIVDPRNGFTYSVPDRAARIYRFAGRQPTGAEGAHESLSNAGWAISGKWMHPEYMRGVGIAYSKQAPESQVHPTAVFPGEVRVYDGLNQVRAFATSFPGARVQYCENNHAVCVVSDYWIGRSGGPLAGKGFVQWFALGARVEDPEPPPEEPPPDIPPIEPPPPDDPPPDPDPEPEPPPPPPSGPQVIGPPPGLEFHVNPYRCRTSGNTISTRPQVIPRPASGEMATFAMWFKLLRPGQHPNTDTLLGFDEWLQAFGNSVNEVDQIPGWKVVYEGGIPAPAPTCGAGPAAEPFDLYVRHTDFLKTKVSPWSAPLPLRANLPDPPA